MQYENKFETEFRSSSDAPETEFNTDFGSSSDVYDKILGWLKPPYIGDNGNWFIFDANSGEFVDSGVSAIDDITNESAKALEDIETSKNDALTGISAASTEALKNIEFLGSETLEGVEGAKGKALEEIDDAANKAVKEIESKTPFSIDDGDVCFENDVKSTDSANIIHSLNDSGKGIINDAVGTSIYLNDSDESALVDLSVDKEGAKIYVCGNNLFNPLHISASNTQFSSNQNATSYRPALKHDHGLKINSTTYDSETGIIAIQEDTQTDGVTPVSNITDGYFLIYFDNPTPYYKFGQVYTFIADYEVLENKHPDGSLQVNIKGATLPNNFFNLPSTKGKICTKVTCNQNATHPYRHCIEVYTKGKSMHFKNIMWLEGDWRNNPPKYEDYKEQMITNVEDYKNFHTYYPKTRIVTDVDDATISVKYKADTKNYIDNKIAELAALTLEV